MSVGYMEEFLAIFVLNGPFKLKFLAITKVQKSRIAELNIAGISIKHQASVRMLFAICP